MSGPEGRSCLASPSEPTDQGGPPRGISDADAWEDRQWFSEHPGRSCYARACSEGWVLVVKQVPQGNAAPVMLRVWVRVEHVPEDEGACLALWQRAVWLA